MQYTEIEALSSTCPAREILPTTVRDIRQWPALLEKSLGERRGGGLSRACQVKRETAECFDAACEPIKRIGHQIYETWNGCLSGKALKNECVLTARLTTKGTQHLLNQPTRSD